MFPSVQKVVSFLKKKNAASIYFVNDGSSDNTNSVLEDLRIKFPKHVRVINREKNEGKAAAVRLGMNNALRNNKFDSFAFLDADLSTSIEECILLSEKITKKISFVFGSRGCEAVAVPLYTKLPEPRCGVRKPNSKTPWRPVQ